MMVCKDCRFDGRSNCYDEVEAPAEEKTYPVPSNLDQELEKFLDDYGVRVEDYDKEVVLSDLKAIVLRHTSLLPQSGRKMTPEEFKKFSQKSANLIVAGLRNLK